MIIHVGFVLPVLLEHNADQVGGLNGRLPLLVG